VGVYTPQTPQQRGVMCNTWSGRPGEVILGNCPGAKLQQLKGTGSVTLVPRHELRASQSTKHSEQDL